MVIGEMTEIRAGFPFRGAIEAIPNGPVIAVQMKDVAPASDIDWGHVLRTELPGRKQADWLQPADVLVVSRGARFLAVCLDAPPGPAVCSPHFFHLRIRADAGVVPAFISWQINQPPFQRQLQQAAEGSSQLSIRRPVFEALVINVPSLAQQQRIVALAEMAKQERRVLHQLVRNREQQLEALAEQLATAAATRT